MTCIFFPVKKKTESVCAFFLSLSLFLEKNIIEWHEHNMSKNKTIMKTTKINETAGSVPEFIQKLFRYYFKCNHVKASK